MLESFTNLTAAISVALLLAIVFDLVCRTRIGWSTQLGNLSASTKFCVSILAIVILVGCSSGSDNQTSGSTTEGAKSTDQTVRANNETASVSLPTEFPRDVHLVDGATVTNFNENYGSDNLNLEHRASDLDELVKKYQEGMVQKGWTQVKSSKLPQIGTITEFSKDNRQCLITMDPPKDQVIKVAISLRKDE